MPVVLTIDGFPLNGDMRLLERSQQLKNSMSIKRTLGGGAVVYSGTLLAGIPVTLQAGDDYGWLTATQRDFLIALSEIPGAFHTLSFNGRTYQVIFDFTSGPAVDLEPVEKYTNEGAQDAFIGFLRFVTV